MSNPKLPPGVVLTRRTGTTFSDKLSLLFSDKKFVMNLLGLGLSLVAIVVPVLWYGGYFKSEPTPTPEATLAALPMPTYTPYPTYTPAPAAISGEIAQATAQLSPLEAAATATSFYKYTRPAVDMAHIRLLVGSIRLDPGFGYCRQTNIGFVASGSPYFLFMELGQLPNQDLFNTQTQVLGYTEVVSDCQYPLIKVSEIRYTGQATPAPLRLAQGGSADNGQIVLTNTNGLTITATPYFISNQFTPIPKDSNDPSARWQPTPVSTVTIAQKMNIFGRTTQITGCLQTTFGIATSSGELLIEFAGATFPAKPEGGDEVILTGESTTICGRAAIRATTATYPTTNAGAAAVVLTQAAVPTGTPKPTKAPTLTPTPSKVTVSGKFVFDSGCLLTSFGIEADNGEFYYLQPLSDDLWNIDEGKIVVVTGLLDTSGNCNSMLRVNKIKEIIPTSIPTATFTPTPTPTLTLTPTVTPTITNTPIPTPIPSSTATSSPTPIDVLSPIEEPVEPLEQTEAR